MSKQQETPFGVVSHGDDTFVFEASVGFIREAVVSTGGVARIALTGGSTPKAFYRWAVKERAFSAAEYDRVQWTVSDERCVPLDSDESNFGHAMRELLEPGGFAAETYLPWPTDLTPHEAARSYAHQVMPSQQGWLYDLCFVGMGDDGHTLSLFPHCPLLQDDAGEPFAAVEWPGRGWRLTLTPAGLNKCRRIVVVIRGAEKQRVLDRLLQESGSVGALPIRILAEHRERVHWLVGQEAS